MSFRLALGAVTLLLALGACTSNDDDTPENDPFLGAVRGINALAELEDVRWRVIFEDFDPSVSTQLFFRAASPQVEFSQRSYAFSFDVLLPGDEDTTLIIETTGTIDPEIIYDYVITGTFADPQIFLWTQPRRDWAQELADAADNGTEITELVVSFGHVATGVGAVDVYFEAPGTDITAATPIATMAFGQLAPPATVEGGTYQLTLTPEGDPNTVLYASEDLDVLAANTALFTIMENGGITTQAVSVQLYVDSLGSTVSDVTTPGVLSVVHGSPDAAAIDVFNSDNFDMPLISGLAFGELSDDVVVEEGEIDLAVTPADDVGAILAEQTVDVPATAYRRVFVVGAPGELQSFSVEDDRRAFLTQGRLRGVNASTRFDTVDVYLLDPGADLEESTPAITNLSFAGASTIATIDPGTYELVVTEVDTTTILFGRSELVIDAGDVVELIVIDDAESTNADVFVLQTAGE
ncbi:MAG: DUF4397 domain-containing protein [Pseudomonadota bacterium]